MKTALITAVGVLCPCAVATADLILGVTPSSNLSNFTGTHLINTVNGAGLPGNLPTLTGVHRTAEPDNAWATLDPLPGHLDFDLGGQYLVDGFTFWNLNDSVSAAGIRDVVIRYSPDGSEFLDLIGAPIVFAQITTATTPGESFSFAPVSATHIRIHVRSDWGDPTATFGFSEIQFSAVPSPASIAPLALGGLLCARRRRGA